MEKINLKLEEAEKLLYFELMRDQVKIPTCKNCGNLFSFGFPNSEIGLADHLICEENHLICECEYSKIVRNLFSDLKDGVIDISMYYDRRK